MAFKLSTTSRSNAGRGSRTGKGCGTLFFGLFFVMGSIFTVFIAAETVKQLAPWWWPEVACTVVSSDVADTGDDESPYRASVHYRYEVDGRGYESDRFFRSGGETASYDRARDRAARYPAGAESICRVNHVDPELAVLERRIPWIAFAVLLPLVFVAIGGIGLVATWRAVRPSDEGDQVSISQTAASGRGYKALVLFGLVFVAVGVAVFVPMTGLPAVRFLQSLSWHETPCEILDSRVRSWATDDGTSYRADVLYRYRMADREWTSNRIDFFSFVNSGYDRSRGVEDRYPDGAAATCWVDPSDPSRSVLERRLGPMHLLGLLPLIFVAAGAAVANHGRRKLASRRADGPTRPDEAVQEGAPVVLEPKVGPVGKVVGSLLFAVIWNGIVSIGVYQAWTSWQQGRPEWFLTIFMIPFVLVGLASLAFVGHFVLALANPRPRLTLTPGWPRLGDTIRLEWRFAGRAVRLSRLRIVLEGREEATYQRGTDTHTDREVFATHLLVDTTDRIAMSRGAAEGVVPEDTMHSFEASSNKILWEIKVAGEIARWPDVDQSFPVQVRPMRVEDF